MTIVFQKSLLKSKHAKRIVRDAKLTYFKEKLLAHLDALERKEKKKEQAVQKALIAEEALRKAAFPVGTIREWKGKKYIKTAPGKWRRKYDSEGRGTRLSLAAIKRKVDKCETVEELLQVAKQNKHRFTDENGRYLPVVREMFDYVSKKHKEIKGAKASANVSSNKGKPKAGGSGGGDDGGDGKGLTSKQAANLKKISAALEKNVAEAPQKIEFSKKNFDRLFKNGIDSPIEHIKIGDGQYEKLIDKDRQSLLAVMADVMKDPAIVIKTTDNAKLYAKTYSNMRSGLAVVSVIVDKGNINVSISTHVKRARQLAKKMDSILYEKTESVRGDNTPYGANAPTNNNVSQTGNPVKQETQKNAGKRETAETPDELAQQFGLRDVEISDKVDAKTAQWHDRKCAEGLADIADITGLPDSFMSLNGRLSLVIGADNLKGAYARYSPSNRKLNINKKDGGALAHEWFHAFDNLIVDAMGGESAYYNNSMTGLLGFNSEWKRDLLKKYLDAKDKASREAAYAECLTNSVVLPETSEEEHQMKVASAFVDLIDAMTEGDVVMPEIISHTNADEKNAGKWISADAEGIGGDIYRAGDFDAAAEIIRERFDDMATRKKWWQRASAFYKKWGNWGNGAEVDTGKRASAFLRDAKSMDGKSGSYWHDPSNMAARAFSAYIKDKLAEQGKSNDYLTRIKYDNDERVYPQGEERKRINAAFDKLFQVIAETGAIRKAISATAKKKRWLWIEGGKVWIKKSVMNAWKRAMAEQDEA